MESLCQSKMNETQILSLFDPELRLQGHISDFIFPWPFPLMSYMWSSEIHTIGNHLQNMESPGQKMKEEFAVWAQHCWQTDEQTGEHGTGPITIYFDLLTSECHIGDLKPSLSYTYHQQSSCKLWTIHQKLKKKFPLWAIRNVLSIFERVYQKWNRGSYYEP